MNKKLSILMCIVICVALLAGCAGTPTTVTTATTKATTVATTTKGETTTTAETSTEIKPVTLTVMLWEQAGAPLTGDELTFQAIKEATGVSLEFTNVPSADYAQRFQTVMASGSYPDLVETYGVDPTEYIRAGTFLKLDDLLSDFGSNILRRYDEYGVTEAIKHSDGSFYQVKALTERVFLINNHINNRWLEETNQAMPTTLNELRSVLVNFKQAKGSDSIPFGCGAWAGAGASITNMVKKSYGVQSGFYLYDDGYMFGPYERQDRYMAALKWLASAYADNLLDPQLFSTNDDEIIKQLNNDNVGFFSSWADGFSLWGKDGSYGIDFVPAPVMDTEFGKGYEIRTDPVNVGYSLSKTCKDPEAAIRLFDYIFSDEGNNLMNWGIEGVTYTEATDGTRAYTDLVMKHEAGPVMGRYSNGLVPPHFMHIRDKDAEYLLNHPMTAEFEGLIEGKNFPLQPVLVPTMEEQDEYTTIMTDITKYVQEQETLFVTGKLSVDNDFAAFIAQLEKMNIMRAIEIRQAQYQRYTSR